MKNLLLYVGGGVVLLLISLITSFTTVDSGLAEDHGAPYWGTTEIQQEGDRLFKSAGCYACHSYRGQQSQVGGPELDDVGARLNPQAIESFIRNGSAFMPAFEGKLTDDEIKILSTWLSEFQTPIQR